MRVDKFLKNARVIKRRTVAKTACDQGRVKINGQTAKAGDKVNVGDRIEINFGTQTVEIEVLEVRDNVAKNDADKLYRMIQ